MPEQNEDKNEEQHEFFQPLIDKTLKVMHKDGNQLSIMRGVLKKANKDFIFIQGDISTKIIAIRNIEHVSLVEEVKR